MVVTLCLWSLRVVNLLSKVAYKLIKFELSIAILINFFKIIKKFLDLLLIIGFLQLIHNVLDLLFCDSVVKFNHLFIVVHFLDQIYADVFNFLNIWFSVSFTDENHEFFQKVFFHFFDRIFVKFHDLIGYFLCLFQVYWLFKHLLIFVNDLLFEQYFYVRLDKMLSVCIIMFFLVLVRRFCVIILRLIH